MSKVGSWFIEVVPTVVGAREVLSKQLTVPAKEAGTQAGESIGAGVAEGSKAGALKAANSIRDSIVGGAKTAATEAKALLTGVSTGATADAERAAAAMAKASQTMTVALAKQATAADATAVAQQKLAAAQEKFGAESVQAAAAQANYNKALRDEQLAGDKVAASQERLAVAQKSVRESSEVAGVSSAALGSKLGSMSGVVGGLQSKYAKLGAVVGVALAADLGVKAVKAAGDFQASQERLVTTAGESQKALNGVSNGILKMAGDVGYSAKELSTGMYTVESAGYHAADGLTVLKASAQGAKAENADLTTVTDAVTSSMRDYHLPASAAATVTSKLVTAVGDGKTNFEQFTGALSAVLPVASATHISMNEVLGDLSSMTLHGMSAEQSSQNLAMAIRSLANPTQAMNKEMASLGLNSADLSKKLGQTGVAGTMQQVSQAILQHMGPAGTTLLNAFNQSKQAAQDAQTMFQALPPAAQKVAQAYQSGSMSLKDYRTALKAMPAAQAALVQQWASTENGAKGFNQALKGGGAASQTFTQALAKATGNSTSLNVALMLTGENASKTQQNIKDVGKAAAESGNNVKGWADTQATFNTRMAQFKDAMGSVKIELGNALLPAFSAFAKVLSTVGGFLANHPTLVKVLAAALFTLAAGIAAVNIAMWAMATDPFAWVIAGIVVAVIALIAAVVLLATHWRQVWSAISSAVSAVWNGVLKPVFNAIGAGALWFYNNAIKPAATGIGVAFRAIGTAATWLYHSVLQPVFNFIGEAAKILARVVLVVLVAPFVLAFKNVLAPVVMWLWHSVISPVFNLIGNIFNWLYRNVVKPVIADIELGIRAWAQVFQWIYDSVIKPVGHAIGDIFNWIWRNVISPVINDIKLGIHAWAQVFQWIYDNVIKPVGHAIGDVMTAIGKSFDTAVNFIERTWNKIIDIAKKPINFVIGTIYNDGIRALWNHLADVFDKSWELPKVAQLAGGGILPGYQPGQDTIPAMLSPGEAVLVPEAARAIGHNNILALNKAASGRNAGSGVSTGRGGFSGGGIAHFAGGGIVSDLIGGAKDIGSLMMGGLSGLGNAVKGIFSSVLGGFSGLSLGGGSQGGELLGVLQKVPSKAVSGIVEFLKKQWGKIFGGSGSGAGVAGVIPAGMHKTLIDEALAADGIPTGDWPRWEIGMNTLIGRESSWNAGIVNTWDSNAAAGHPSGGLTQTIYSTFEGNRNPGLPNNMFNPVANIAASINYIRRTYGDIGNVQQANANLPPKGYDNGGWLPPGKTLVDNQTGRPEPVFNPQQWQTLQSGLGSGGGSNKTYNITTYDPSSVVAEINRREAIELATHL